MCIRDSFESMGTEEFNLPTSNGGHATAKNNVNGKQAYNYIRFTPTAVSYTHLSATSANTAGFGPTSTVLPDEPHRES